MGDARIIEVRAGARIAPGGNPPPGVGVGGSGGADGPGTALRGRGREGMPGSVGGRCHVVLTWGANEAGAVEA